MPSSSATVRYGLPYLYRQRTGADPGHAGQVSSSAYRLSRRKGKLQGGIAQREQPHWIGRGSRDSQLNEGWVGNYFCKHCLCRIPGVCLRYSSKNFTHAGLGISILAPLGVIFPVSGSTANVIIWLVV